MNMTFAAQVGLVLMLAIVGYLLIRCRRLEKRLLDAEESLMTERLRAGAERMAQEIARIDKMMIDSVRDYEDWRFAHPKHGPKPLTIAEKVDALLLHLGLKVVATEGRKVTVEQMKLAPDMNPHGGSQKT